MRNNNTKRERLLAATDILFLQRGFDSVTISDIATLAEVPMGNVYYYFKSKNLMLEQVLQIRLEEFKNTLLKIEQENKNIKVQLHEFIKMFLDFPKENIPEDVLSLYKNKRDVKDSQEEHSSLGRFISITLLELEKQQNIELFPFFAPVIDVILAWCNNKFKELGREKSEELAINFFNTLVGISVLSLSTNLKYYTEEVIKNSIQFLIDTFNLTLDGTEDNISKFPDRNHTSAWKK